MRLSHASRLMLVALTRVILAAELRISIPPFPPLLDNPAILPSSTHATLLGADSLQTAHLSSQNTFSFADLAQGSYLLDIHTKDYIFPPFRVDVSSPTAASEPGAGSAQGVDARMSATSIATAGSSDTQQLQQHPGPAILTVHTTFRGNEWSNLGPRIGSSAPGSDRLDVAVHPVAKKQFYVPRAGFSLLAFFKSPMILMGLFTCVVVFGFPKLMENSMLELPRAHMIWLLMSDANS